MTDLQSGLPPKALAERYRRWRLRRAMRVVAAEFTLRYIGQPNFDKRGVGDKIEFGFTQEIRLDHTQRFRKVADALKNQMETTA